MHEYKIDFVLPWVDPNDQEWQKEKAYYAASDNTEDNASQTRFRDMNTLKYVLRSIEKNCPWYNKIYLITTGHYPKWLDISHPKIELITHEELFIDKTVLPVFNSNAIEMNLVNIKGLSESFVYLSDDTIIWNVLEVERFFKNNKPVDFFHHGWIPRNHLFQLLKGKDIWIDALNNNLKLINAHIISKMTNNHYFHASYTSKNKLRNMLLKYVYKKPFWINHWHHPQPYKRSTIQAVYTHFEEEMLQTTKHKFRSSKDITPYLYRYWHLIKGDFEPFFHNDGYVSRMKSLNAFQKEIADIENNETINFVCFNDQVSPKYQNEVNEIVETLEAYLQSKFPNPASFELL